MSAAKNAGLDKVVITDHNSIQGAQLAKKMAPWLFIVGEEIQTTAGELLAVFVKEEVPKGLQPMEAVHALREQGAFISISHPFDPYRSGWTLSQLEEIAPHIDAIEIMNARSLLPVWNARAVEFAQSHKLPGTAGSDAHLPIEVGRVALELPDFNDLNSLWHSIKEGNPVGEISPFWVHFGSTWAKFIKAMSRKEIELL